MEPAAGLVVTERGPVRGVDEGDTWSWKGIPYAAPPVGQLRWRPPEPPACWSGVLDADAFGPKCLQRGENGEVVGAEDCLTLNVWAPKGDAPEGGWPVMVFVHGGGNVQGSSSETVPGGAPLYDGRFLAQREGVVVVTLNYRLGALGFLAHEALSAESSDGGSGNYGLMDQIAALEWVRDNVAGFGGDPTRVMLFGESASGVDALALLASPLAEGLFRAVLVQSGGARGLPLDEAEAEGAERVAETSCGDAEDVLACLRDLDGSTIVETMPGVVGIGELELGAGSRVFGPVVDGRVLEQPPLQAVEAGAHHAVPFVVGTNLDEAPDPTKRRRRPRRRIGSPGSRGRWTEPSLERLQAASIAQETW